MRAAVIRGSGVKEVELLDDATTVGPDPAEVKVRIRATGVCHSDLSILSGTLPNNYPAVLGHEAAGDVVEVGAQVTAVAPGDRVVICWTPSCGLCPDCVAGRPFLCVKYIIEGYTKPRFRLGDGTPAYGMAGCGTWAEEMVVPWEACITVDDDVPYEYAALLGCGISTGVGAVINTARVRPGTKVAVVGCGGVGLSVIQGAKAAGAATILAIDPLESKHEIAKNFGATHTATPDQVADVKNLLTGGLGFDYGFEVVGRSSTIRAAWELTRRGGDVIVVGAGAADDTVRVQRLRAALRRQEPQGLAVRQLGPAPRRPALRGPVAGRPAGPGEPDHPTHPVRGPQRRDRDARTRRRDPAGRPLRLTTRRAQDAVVTGGLPRAAGDVPSSYVVTV